MKRNTRQRLLDLIVARLGVPEVARRLDIEGRVVDTWLQGSAEIPNDKLIAIVDLLEQTGVP